MLRWPEYVGILGQVIGCESISIFGGTKGSVNLVFG